MNLSEATSDFTGQTKADFMEQRDGRTVENAVEARAGRLGRPVLAVLIVSTSLAIIFFAATYLGFFSL
jgi:hypothetical protein